jgi:uncharacterized caspase-like protein
VLRRDRERRAINAKLVEFTGKVTPGDTALFFYAGHGVTMGGTSCPPTRRRLVKARRL